MLDGFDILKKLPDGGIVWIESAKDLESARQRIEQFSRYKPGEYVIFSQETQSVLTLPLTPFTRDPVAPAEEKPKASQVMADIVADIRRAIRHKH